MLQFTDSVLHGTIATAVHSCFSQQPLTLQTLKSKRYILSADLGRWEKVSNWSSVIVSALDIKAVQYFIMHIYLLLFIVLTLLIDGN